MNNIQTDPELTEATRALRAKMSTTRWAEAEAEARRYASILERVEALRASPMSWRRALAAVAPEVPWPTFLNWRRRVDSREGAVWERLLDTRVPPPPRTVDPAVVAGACMLRRVDRTISCADARSHLIRQFGLELGQVSDAKLKRIWKEAGLGQPRGGTRAKRETVTRFNGGAGLALIGAAAVETGAVDALAAAVVEKVKSEVASREAAGSPSPGVSERDGNGRFTAGYNQVVRGTSGRDPRWDSDAQKRERRSLSSTAVGSSNAATVAAKLLALGVTPLITERRGFDGLEGPSGAWLSVLGSTAYQAATLDKFLGELALADVGEALWTAHGQKWAELTASWRSDPEAPPWLRWAVYVDATQDPYWTHAFAASGKVSRVNRVMPCITKVAVMGGPGVPLVVETHAGQVSLKEALLPCLDRVEAAVGESELGRLTVMDAEMATVPLMSALAAREDTWFVTVLKGSIAKSGDRGEPTEWERFRERDLLREVSIRFEGGSAPTEGLRLRGVEMVREGSRNPVTTTFVTNAPPEALALADVPASYLSRWPHQEQRFRDGRNGLGMDKSHGYGGSAVTHVALLTKQEKAQRSVERAKAKVAAAERAEEAARDLHAATATGRRNAARVGVQAAERATRAARRSLADAEAAQQKIATTPREIYVRDTTRDGIVTAMKMTVLMLIEFVLKEYFGGQSMEVRTFIEAFMHLPVDVRETADEIAYELHDNPRSPERTAQLRRACEEATRRELRRGKKRLRFVLLGGG